MRRDVVRRMRAAGHQPSGQFPAVTISFGLKEGESLETATAAVQQTVLDMRMPDIVQAEFAADAKAFAASAGAQPLLVLAALVAVYLVLRHSYEASRIRSPSSRPCRPPASARCWRCRLPARS